MEFHLILYMSVFLPIATLLIHGLTRKEGLLILLDTSKIVESSTEYLLQK